MLHFAIFTFLAIVLFYFIMNISGVATNGKANNCGDKQGTTTTASTTTTIAQGQTTTSFTTTTSSARLFILKIKLQDV